jgi:hypothetical protein
MVKVIDKLELKVVVNCYEGEVDWESWDGDALGRVT